jgi:thiol:disulfide interchange protein
VVAVVYSAGLVVAGFLVPVYSTESVSSGGAVSEGTATLVAENGIGVVFVLGIPLLVTLLVGAALRDSSRRGMLPVAWTLTGLLAVFNLLAMLTIGVFVLPVTGALALACATCRRPRSGER